MLSQKRRVAGWIMSAILAGFLMFSASGKFVDWEGKTQMLDHLGYSTHLMMKIGATELILAALFLVPRAGFLGSLLLTAYLGGATATHVRVGDPFFMPIIFGVLVWVSYGLRRPGLFSLATGSTVAACHDAPRTSV
mgnify:CR=1 FL=1